MTEEVIISEEIAEAMETLLEKALMDTNFADLRLITGTFAMDRKAQ
jgi:hypothetical protein